jgi:hypothetical protein
MRTKRVLIAAVAVLLFASAASAEVQTREIEYKQGDTVLVGLMAWGGAVRNLWACPASRPSWPVPFRGRPRAS